MKLICLVKFVPDVDKFKYDFERNTVVRENIRMILNPDDACAVAFALRVKALSPETTIEAVTMGPESIRPMVEDLVRLGVDWVTHISDPVFSGSDSCATARVLARHLHQTSYDLILTGTHAIDGDTSHVPSQVGELLDLFQMSGVVGIDEARLSREKAVFTVDSETASTTYQIDLPAILSLQRESGYKLPYIKRERMTMDVSEDIHLITNDALAFKPEETGLNGSMTMVNRTFVKEYEKRGSVVVGTDEEGIETVYTFLKKKGFV